MYPEWLLEMVVSYCVRIIELFLRIRKIVSRLVVLEEAPLHGCLGHVALIESSSPLRLKQYAGSY